MGAIKRIFRSKWLWLTLGVVLLVPVLVFIAGQFTPAPLAWVFKQAIDFTTFKAPPDFETIKGNVLAKTDIPYNEQGTLLDMYYPGDASAPLPVIMWIHGGGFIGGDKRQTTAYAMVLANAGYVVANINYDLAPAQQYPGPVIQANQALAYLRDNAGQYGGDVDRMFLGSNSSGSQIASQLAAIISNPAFAGQMGIQPAVTDEQLKGALLYDGAYNMRTLRATRAPGMSLFLWSYTGVKNFESYERIDELSTVEHVTPDYPPVFLAVGPADALEPQTMELKQALEDQGVEVVLFTGENPALGHDYMMNLDRRAAARRTLAKALDFLKKHSRP
jgi:acetyl esterase/lipase